MCTVNSACKRSRRACVSVWVRCVSMYVWILVYCTAAGFVTQLVWRACLNHHPHFQNTKTK